MIRFKNVKVLTMEEDRAIFDGEVRVEGDRIAYVGKACEAMDIPGTERVIDCRGNLLMPGFKNAHAHSPMTFLRSFADDLELEPWLHTKVFPAEAKLTDDDAYWCTLLAIMEYLTSGITAAFDMYFLKEPVARAANDAGFRMVLCGALNDFCESIAQEEQGYLRYQNSQGLVTYQLGAHAEYTMNRSLLSELAALSAKLKAPVYIHLAETEKEVEDCIRKTGMSPVAYLDSLGLFDYGGGGFHMVHLCEGDYEIIRKRRLFCITNPGSNVKLASGIAPLNRFISLGIPVAIGTDGAASNNCLDMFREMFLAAGLQKLQEKSASAMPAAKVLEMAAVTGAEAMGLPECRYIRVGMKADMILIDLERPNMQPISNPAVNLVYSGSKENVKLTMINGKILYENGVFDIGIDKEEVYRQVNRIFHKIQQI